MAALVRKGKLDHIPGIARGLRIAEGAGPLKDGHGEQIDLPGDTQDQDRPVRAGFGVQHARTLTDLDDSDCPELVKHRPGNTRMKLYRFTAGGRCGQGRGRTADLPLFRRSLVPTELPGRASPALETTAPDIRWSDPDGTRTRDLRRDRATR